MKKILLAFCSGCVLFAGCKENDVPYVFTNVPAVETTYVVSQVPAADAHNVLIEEFTGQSCSNCPAAHVVLDSIIAAHPAGTVNVVGMYIIGPPQSNPLGKHDLRDSIATNISNQVFNGISSMPVASIDRLPVAGILLQGSGSWSGVTSTRLSAADPLNLTVRSNYNATTGVATIIATVTYTQQVSIPQNISLVIVEDSIVDMQLYSVFDPAYPSGVDTFYEFTNVFRGMISSPPFGDVINTPTVKKEAGRVYSRTYTYKPKNITPAIKPEHCRVIAFVNTNNGADYHIVQSAQCPLKP
jgi:hypothetical protein